MEREMLVKNAIAAAADKAAEATYEEKINGVVARYFFYAKNGEVWLKFYAGADLVKESRVYCIESGRPYIRAYSSRFYIEDGALEAMKKVL